MPERYIQKWLSSIKEKPLVFIIGVGIIISAAFGASVNNVSSTVLAAWFIISIFFIRKWNTYWQNLYQIEKFVLIGFMLYTVSGFLSYYNVSDEYEYVKHMGRSIRFTLIVPVYLVIRYLGKEVFNYFLAGLIVSGPVFLIFALLSINENSSVPASGQYHHIVFGDTAMLNALIMISIAFARKISGTLRVLTLISIICALYACVLSTTRGAWVVFPLIVGLYIIYYVKEYKITLVRVILPLVIFTGVISVIPQTRDPIASGAVQAIDEVSAFYKEGLHITSVGGRLALWDVAIDIWKQHPLIGTGPGDLNDDLMQMQKQGVYPSLKVFGSAHNIYFQSLAVGGIIGVAVMVMGLVVLPALLFYRNIEGMGSMAALAGLVTVLSFAVFGLTESWTLRAPMVSVYLAYFVVTAAQTARESRKV